MVLSHSNSDFRPSKPSPSPSGLEQQVARALGELLMLAEHGGKHRTFDPIIRPADGTSGWRTMHQCMESSAVARLVLDSDWIGGIRHRHYTRLIVFDIDNKPGRPSPYWHPAGPDHSPAFQRLLSAAEAAGCAIAVFRTPSGGWHAWAALPDAVHHSVAARVGLALVRRACMEVKPGVVEVFPNLAGWSTGSDAKTWKRCHGFRLPGQIGGSVWLGSGRWSNEPTDAWAEAEAAADLAEGNATDAWESLLTEAAAIRHHRPAAAAGAHRRRPRRDHGIRWTGSGESNRNLGLLANALYQPGEDCETFGRRIAAAARSAAGFDQHASDDTRRQLDQKARAWARCCINKPPTASARRRTASADPNRNANLRQRSTARLAAGVFRAVRLYGAAALAWSERKIAHHVGLSRTVYRKLRAVWRMRLNAAIYAPRSVGTHPHSKGGGHRRNERSGRGTAQPCCDPAAVSAVNPSLDPIPPPTSAADRHHPAFPPAMPITPARSPSPRREAERRELLVWLGIETDS